MADAKKEKGELVAEESLEFVVSLEKRPSFVLSTYYRYKYREDVPCENCLGDDTFFKFEFGVRGKDGNKYPFIIELWKTDDCDEEINVILSLQPSGGELFVS